MNREKSLIFGALLSLISYFCLASTNTLVKLLDGRLHVFQILLLQNSVGLIIILLTCACQKKPLTFYQSNHYVLLFLRAIGGVGAFYFLFIAVSYVSVTNATLLLNTAPLFVPFFLLLCFHEKIYHRLWLGIIPGFIGIALILKPGTDLFQWEALFPLISGLFMATLFVVLRQLHFHKESTLRIFVYLFVCSVVITLPFAMIHWQRPTSYEWILLTLISLSSFFSQTLITFSLRYGSASALAPLCYTSIVFSLLYDWFIWQHTPSWTSLCGIVLVITGGLIALYIETRRKTTE